MSSRFKRIIVILTALVAVMIMCAVSVCADDGDDYEYQLAICGKNIMAADGTVIESALPEGVKFNNGTWILTLTDCTLDITGTDATSFIQVKKGFTKLKIVLEGNNVFKGQSAKSDFTGIDMPGELEIDGKGSLTMDLSECKGTVTGISAQDNLSIANTSYSGGNITVNIDGGDTRRSGSFTGISMYPYRNYYTEDGEQHQIKIKTAKLKISNSTSNTADYSPFENIGIDGNDSDIDIVDSIVSIDLTGGGTTGIQCGMPGTSDANPVFGGKLSVSEFSDYDDISTRVSVRLHDPANDNPCAAIIYEDGVNLSYKYMANPDNESDVKWLQGFYHQWLIDEAPEGGKLSSPYKYLELSADYISEYASDDSGEDTGDDPVEEAADPSKPVLLLGTNIVVSDGNEGYMADTTGIPGVTGSVSFNIMTRTLTLDNCTFDGNGGISYLESEGPLNVVLKGSNVFRGAVADGTSEDTFFGILSEGKLSIKGSGSLTMKFGNVDGDVTGIQGNNIIDIDGPTIRMEGPTGSYFAKTTIPVRHGDFYGIRMDPDCHNYYEHSGYSGLEFYVAIQNADIEISNSNAATNLKGNLVNYYNIGVNTGDSDLHISNSRINLTLRGSIPKGLCAGYYSYADNERFGGKLSIDDRSWVKIRLIDPITGAAALKFFQEYDPDTYEYVSVHDFIKSKYIYIGNQINGSFDEPITWKLWDESQDGTDFSNTFWPGLLIEHGDEQDRVCKHQALELSPDPVDHSKPESTDPDEEIFPDTPDDPAPAEDKPEVGDKVTGSYGTATITSTKAKTLKVTAVKNKKSVTIPDTAVVGGVTYKITEVAPTALKKSKIRTVTLGRNIKVIRKNTFKGTKITTVIIKSKLLSKAKVKGSLAGSKVKTIQVKVGSKKVNKTYVKKYKKIFTKKIAGKAVKIK